MPRVLEILSNILNPIEYSYGSTEVSTNYPTFSIAYSIYSILQYSLLVVVNLLRSDDLLYPDYGRSAIGVESLTVLATSMTALLLLLVLRLLSTEQVGSTCSRAR